MNTASLLGWLKKRRIAVLKGGWSKERNISLRTGKAVEESFQRLGVPAIGIDVNPNLALQLKKKRIEFCFIALHGPCGEDGRIQGLLEILNIPYTGSGPLASGLAMDKNISKKLFVGNGIPTPRWITFKQEKFISHPQETIQIISRMMMSRPLFIKPVDQGSAIGATRVDKSRQIAPALEACYKVSQTALVEEFIQGRELTVSLLGEQTLPVIEIIPIHRFYDFHSKYAPGGSKHITPAKISMSATQLAQSISLQSFQALGCGVYGRVDLILRPNGQVSVLEVNTIPGMTSTSLLPEAAKAAGMDFDSLVCKIVELSIMERLSFKND